MQTFVLEVELFYSFTARNFFIRILYLQLHILLMAFSACIDLRAFETEWCSPDSFVRCYINIQAVLLLGPAQSGQLCLH